MISNQEFKDLAMSFQGTMTSAHFDRIAFKVINKRIFSTLHEPSQTANLKLPVQDQRVYSEYGEAIYPVPNKWGLQGWTTFELKRIPRELMLDALSVAYQDVLKTKSEK